MEGRNRNLRSHFVHVWGVRLRMGEWKEGKNLSPDDGIVFLLGRALLLPSLTGQGILCWVFSYPQQKASPVVHGLSHHCDVQS